MWICNQWSSGPLPGARADELKRQIIIEVDAKSAPLILIERLDNYILCVSRHVTFLPRNKRSHS